MRGEEVLPKTNKPTDQKYFYEAGGKKGLSTWTERDVTAKPGTGSFCRLCSAWRGSYGLEPTIELYVQHTVETFREVRRGRLRGDGVLFLNLGLPESLPAGDGGPSMPAPADGGRYRRK